MRLTRNTAAGSGRSGPGRISRRRARRATWDQRAWPDRSRAVGYTAALFQLKRESFARIAGTTIGLLLKSFKAVTTGSLMASMFLSMFTGLWLKRKLLTG